MLHTTTPHNNIYSIRCTKTTNLLSLIAFTYLYIYIKKLITVIVRFFSKQQKSHTLFLIFKKKMHLIFLTNGITH